MTPLATNRRTFLRALTLLAGIALTGSSSGPARADEIAVNTDDDRLAVRGYDVVAFHVLGSALEGDPSHEVIHSGARYWFISAGHAELFRMSPEVYLPAYGGFCSYGIATGRKYDADPEAWDILNGTLYLELDRGIRKVWLRNPDKYIAVADRIWPAIRTVPAKKLGY